MIKDVWDEKYHIEGDPDSSQASAARKLSCEIAYDVLGRINKESNRISKLDQRPKDISIVSRRRVFNPYVEESLLEEVIRILSV